MKKICTLTFVTTWLLSAPLGAQVDYRNIDSAQDVIDHWSPEVHLYVKGPIGVGVAQLQQLETWLDEHAPHWTVVLMQTAAGERYAAPDGRNFEGMDAVEHALGHGLANQTDFGSLVHEQLGEQDGTVFVLFLRERKFSYYSSDAQDRRGLGQSRWIGFLDRPAIRAMRGGGRILDAVKDTVTSINQGLERVIQDELADEARRARAREQALSQANTDIELARQSVEEIENGAAALKQQHPDAEGELAQPPVAAWDRTLTDLAEQLTADNAVTTSQEVERLSAKMEQFQLAYAEHQALDTTLAPIEKQATALLTALEGVARDEAEESLRLVAAARQARDAGELAFRDFVADARRQVELGEAQVAERVAAIERAARRAQLIRRTIFVTVGLIAALLGALLIYLNRRRAPTKREAIAALAQREVSVKREMDRVLRLFERSHEVLGPQERIADRGYEGVTRAKVEDAFSGVNALLVMSAEVQRVMDEARELVFPRNPMARLANLFGGDRYERAMNHISGEPLTFKRSDGLPLVLEGGRAEVGHGHTDVTEMSGGEEEEPPEVITRTFEQVFEAFHDRCDFTAETLDVIEHCLLKVSDRLNELQAEIGAVSELEKQLDAATEDDGFFSVPEFFETLIPSAQHDLEMADDLGAEDPVRAMHELIPSGLRKMRDGRQLSATITRARTEVFPTFDDHAPQLRAFEYDTDWIQETILELSEQANQLFKRAATESVAVAAHQFAEQVTLLGGRVRESAELAHRIHEDLAPAIGEFEQKLAEARSTVARQLNLSPDECIREAHANPDEYLEDAQRQLAAARAAVHLGGVASAREAVTALVEAKSEGNQIVDESLRVLDEFSATLQARRYDHQQTVDQLPNYREELDRVREEYASTALLFRAADPSYEDAGATTESHYRECQALLEESHDFLQQAEPVFQQARLLESNTKLASAERNVQRANQLLEEISVHCHRLADQTQANSDLLAELSGRVGALDSSVQDYRTTRETMEDFARFEEALASTTEQVGANHRDRDPFDNAETLERHVERYQQLEAMIAADRDAHAEAGRAVKGAEAELQKAQRLVRQAQRDGIPDSPKTRQCIQNIARLEDETAQVGNHLAVAHGNWQRVDAEAARINAELGVQASALAGELRLAQESVDLFERASRDVFDATNWTGRYGIRVTGAPGAGHLERAREALRRGDYTGLLQLARAAQTDAAYAIQRAQRLVARRRREEERRAEERRRRRRRSSISIGGSGGGFSIGGSGRSSSSRGSSNSGFSRSGW